MCLEKRKIQTKLYTYEYTVSNEICFVHILILFDMRMTYYSNEMYKLLKERAM